VFWNGRALYDMLGERIRSFPMSLAERLPNMPLEGDLCLEGGSPIQLLELTRNGDEYMKESYWTKVHFYVFDTPQSQLRYEERIMTLEEAFMTNSHHLHDKRIHLATRWRCQGRESLWSYLMDRIYGSLPLDIRYNLRKPNSFYYEPGAFLEAKIFHEAKVISHSKGVQSMHCMLVDGRCFDLPIQEMNNSANTERSLPEPGSILTIRCLSPFQKSGKPVPDRVHFTKLRPDLRWDMLCDLSLLYPYYLADGLKAGIAVTCSGCGRVLPRGELRIRVQSLWFPPNSAPYPGRSSFCLHHRCIKRAHQRNTGVSSNSSPEAFNEDDFPNHNAVQNVSSWRESRSIRVSYP